MTQNIIERVDQLRQADAETRLSFLHETHFIAHPRYMALEDRLHEIVVAPQPHELNIAVFARSFNGKSTLTKHFASLYPIDPNPLGDAACAKVVRVSMPGEASAREFAIRILRYVGEPFNLKWTTSHLTSMMYAVLRSLGTKLLIIDEFQDVGNGTHRNREALKNIVKSIGEDCGCGVALFGTPAGIKIVNKDPQLQRRFEQLTIDPWKPDDETRLFIRNFEVLLPLRKTSNIIADPKLVETICEQGDNVIGHIRRVIVEAAKTAIHTGREVIDAKTLDAAGWVPLSARQDAVLDRLGPLDPEEFELA